MFERQDSMSEEEIFEQEETLSKKELKKQTRLEKKQEKKDLLAERAAVRMEAKERKLEAKRAKKENKEAEIVEAKEEKRVAKKQRRTLSATAFIVPLVFSLLLIGALYILIGNKTESSIDTVNVMYMVQAVDKHSFIPAEDYKKFFKMEETNVTHIPGTAIPGFQVLPEEGIYVRTAMVPNQMVLTDNIAANDPVMNKYTNSVYKTSIACDTFKSSVSGRVRKGDIIDIYAVDPELEELVLFANNVYVEAAYDSNGKECTTDNDVATSFIIWASDAEEISMINLAVVYGKIQIYLTEY